MSEPKLISPLLDHFMMGQPISDHHGVRCCPAMTKDTDKKYIVKIISIPASQVQLDALLLAGAYSSNQAALSYFKELADDVAAEAEVLKKLSRFEGFVPYEDHQIVQMDDGQTGYEIYLLSPYKRSLERHMQKNPMTQLQAVNLGLDLCASMVMCRRAGYLYVDLKPGNIFITEKNEYCIGDLGFVRMDSLKYASLPDKYRSAYTAPELDDPWAAINETVDTFAIGMILYQIYNDGKLPESGDTVPPAYADYEMAEIIQKAIAKDPADRWQDPMEMGQALVAYMQRNSVNDVPIIPLPAPEAPPAEPAADPVAPPQAEPVVDAAPETLDETPAAVAVAPVHPTPDTEPVAPVDPDPTPAPGAQPEVPDASVDPEPENDPEDPEIPPVIVPVTPPAEADDATDLSFMDNLVQDDTAPDENAAGVIPYAELSDETSDILAQADELLAMDSLEPVVAPEPIDIPMPAPIVLDDDTPQDPIVAPVPPLPADTVSADGAADDVPPEDPVVPPVVPVTAPVMAENPATNPDDEEEEIDPPEKKRTNAVGIIALILAILLMFGAAAYAYHYYNTEYLQTIYDLDIQGEKNSMTVTLNTEIDDSLLTVVCADSYGNMISAPVENGTAVFKDLNPDTIYNVTVIIDGFHELRGQTSATFTTPAQTNIVQFEATAGNEPGSVILTFTVDGEDSDSWTISYSAEGENERSETFAGHILTVNGLTAGKEYTFRLSCGDELYLVGNDTVTYAISAPVYAEGLSITKCTSEGITAVWTAPDGAEGTLWTVRCYSDGDFDQTIETSDLTATFTGINPSEAFTIEVTAQGMTTGTMTHISARSATITGSTADTSKALTLKATWTFGGDAPQGGWLVTYRAEGAAEEQTVLVTEPEVSIYPAMPGEVFHFTVKAADGTTVFDNTFSHTAGDVQVFSGYGVTADNMSFRMCRTPSYTNWSWEDLIWSDYTSSFGSGEKASFVVELTKTPARSDDYIDVLFVIRSNSTREIVCSSSTGASWTFLWDNYHCELDIPTMPTESGDYTIDIYFNGMAAARDYFTID